MSEDAEDISFDDMFDLQFIGVKQSRAHALYAQVPSEVPIKLSQSFSVELDIDSKLQTYSDLDLLAKIVAPRPPGTQTISFYGLKEVFYGPFDADKQLIQYKKETQIARFKGATAVKRECISVNDYFKQANTCVNLRGHSEKLKKDQLAEKRFRLQQLMLILGVARSDIPTNIVSKPEVSQALSTLTTHLRNFPLNVSMVEDVGAIVQLIEFSLDVSKSSDHVNSVLRYLADIKRQSDNNLISRVKTVKEVVDG